MADNLTDQELHALFREHMPLQPLPPELAMQLQQQVLAAVEMTLKPSSRTDASAVWSEAEPPLRFEADHPSDPQLHALFREHMPPQPLPAELAAQLQQQVLAAVATTLKAPSITDASNGVAARTTHSASSLDTRQNWNSRRSTQLAIRPWTRWLTLLREKFWSAPYLALAGAALTLVMVIGLFRAEIARFPKATPSPMAQANSITGVPATPRQAMVIVTGGTATIERQTGETEVLVAGTAKKALGPGDRLITGTSTARIEYFEGQSTTVEPGGDVVLQEYTEEGPTTRIALVVNTGKTSHEVDAALASDDLFEVRTPAAVASMKQTKLTVDTLSPTQTHIEAETGSAQIVTNNGGEVVVAAGEELTATVGTLTVVVQTTATLTPTEPAEKPLQQSYPAPSTNTPVPSIPTWPALPSIFPIAGTATAPIIGPPPPTLTATSTPSPLPTKTSAPTSAPTVVVTLSATPTNIQSPVVVLTPTSTGTPILIPSPTPVSTLPPLIPTNTPTSTTAPEPTTSTPLSPTSTVTSTPELPTHTAVPPAATEIPSTNTPTTIPTATATDTPVLPTDTPTDIPTATATDIPAPPIDTPTDIPTATATDTPAPPTDTPTDIPTATDTPVPTDTPTETDTPAPTDTPTDLPPATDTPAPPTDVSTATNTLDVSTDTPEPVTETATPEPPMDTPTATDTPESATETPTDTQGPATQPITG